MLTGPISHQHMFLSSPQALGGPITASQLNQTLRRTSKEDRSCQFQAWHYTYNLWLADPRNLKTFCILSPIARFPIAGCMTKSGENWCPRPKPKATVALKVVAGEFP